MPGLLSSWLYLVSSFRLLSVFLGVFKPEVLRAQLFSRAPKEATTLQLRTFASWTSITCFLTAACAADIENQTLRYVTAFSFGVVLVSFSGEFFYYKTMGVADFLRTAPIATISLVGLLLY